MFIYKITNTKNNKCYIGQTINSVETRFKRHLNDANRLDTHFARALKKYPTENFKIEIIDTATSQEELNQKEHDWIIYYDSINNGYNETSAINKCGGNTYKSKTDEELSKIGEKIRQTKIGGKNNNARKVKCKSRKTNEELHFNSQAEMRDYFKESNHQFISRRCLGQIKCLYKGEWAIAYEDDEYGTQYTTHKNNIKAKEIKVKKLSTGEEKIFPSYAAAERYFEQKPRAFSSKAYKRGDVFTYNEEYEITKIFK